MQILNKMSNLINPLTGRISSKFGTRIHPVSGVKSFHNGVDISVAIGTKVAAPDDGIISEYWDHKTGGKSLAMISGNGFRYGFAHLSRRLVTKGTKVKAGQIIAESGNTGLGTGAHLHFTVKINNEWVDPLKYFSFT